MGYGVKLIQKIGNKEYMSYVGLDCGCYVPVSNVNESVSMTKKSAEGFALNAAKMIPNNHIIRGEIFIKNKIQ